jgi:DNA polymerase-3 subunit beta
MKVICTQENLKTALQTVSRIISSSSTLPVLNNVLLKTENGQLKVSSTNLEIGINTFTRCKIETEGEVCLHAKTLLELVNNLPNQNITILKEEGDVLLVTENYSTKLKDFPSEEFPSIPEINTPSVLKISTSEIKSAIDSVIFAASTSETQPEISGLYFSLQEKILTLTATDRYRLAEKKITGNFNLHQPVIIPHRAALEISRILTGRTGDTEIFLNDNQVAVRIDDTEIISRLIDGQYPEYTHIIPTEFNTTISISRADLVNAVKTAGIFSQNTGSIVMDYQSESQELKISAVSHDLGESTVRLAGAIDGQSGTVFLNYRYVLDCLNGMAAEHINIKVVDDSAPVILQEVDKQDYIYLIMPIKS